MEGIYWNSVQRAGNIQDNLEDIRCLQECLLLEHEVRLYADHCQVRILQKLIEYLKKYGKQQKSHYGPTRNYVRKSGKQHSGHQSLNQYKRKETYKLYKLSYNTNNSMS